VINVQMSLSDIVVCDSCKNKKKRFDTLIVENDKGRFRLCRDCYSMYENQRKLNQDYQRVKKSIKRINLVDMDAIDIMKKKENFIKKIKEGYGRKNV